MTTAEKFYSATALVLVVLGVAWLVTGQTTLGATLLALGGAMYAYATTPHDGDEHIR